MRLYILVLLSLTQFIYAQNKQNWSYKDNTAPQYWANLNPLYLGCAEGNQQSPINIVTKNVSKGAAQFELKYSVAKGVNLMLSNYTFKMIYPQGNFLEMNGNRYQLKEIYFKTPGENAIDSLRGILEAQFLHEDSKGHKVILAVFFVEERSNPVIETLVKNLPTQPDKANFIANIDIHKLLPSNLTSYQFDGSLTTPPCSQGVRWIVLKQTMTITQSQVDSMRDITGSNARPSQEIFNRLIVN
ncbi:carbonic anhydrase family protein [Helicobacter bilis]|uniref:carbonic anhydrase n=1 Tax=Helicobacter bilis TaxID=37372 RepID=A0A4U8U6H3_9HELI|nr:carbonic anhydrase family protein [Helicobacter bilis]MCI7411494.1 carbonic anhydrase family protein [Helicobacter bilis]MDD7296545.1 carbonic anhydrase family protein [Helicobacter bilis]MDY4400371.1 carbonic anhydrase family protein [Helicobacter bilis]TLE08696.1 carbonic anhydrase [Helicobacter bilis]TLE08924.1 carbonic anhydrase [Helicobacter bilis]